MLHGDFFKVSKVSAVFKGETLHKILQLKDDMTFLKELPLNKGETGVLQFVREFLLSRAVSFKNSLIAV